jgi:NADH:ubiquinone oxidoreductase subunit F (NADH-binding)
MSEEVARGVARTLLPEKAIQSLDQYLAIGGGQAIGKALSMPSQQVIAEMKRSGLRGRGGAGFPTGVKWASVAHDPCPTKYLVCNGAEGEPGTFKDRYLMRNNPYQLLEGMAIASHAVNAKKAYLGMKKSFETEYAAVSKALKEMSARGLLGPTLFEIVLGPEDYLFGEEKALLEVVEGGEALPREADFPPYIKGLFATPTDLNPAVVNNVETLSNIPNIILRGADWFRSVGTPDSPGTMIFTVSGDVQKPGIYELPMGTPLRQLIHQYSGGVRPGRSVKAVFSGISSTVIMPFALDTPLEFGAMRSIGSGLGSGGFVVYDDTTCMVRVAHRFSEFLFVESCAQCISCKTGTNQATRNLQKLIAGSGGEIELEYVLAGTRMAPSANRCYLPVEHSLLIPSIVTNFSTEFIQHYNRGCQSCREVVVPKMADFDESTSTFTYARTRTADQVAAWNY